MNWELPLRTRIYGVHSRRCRARRASAFEINKVTSSPSSQSRPLTDPPITPTAIARYAFPPHHHTAIGTVLCNFAANSDHLIAISLLSTSTDLDKMAVHVPLFRFRLQGEKLHPKGSSLCFYFSKQLKNRILCPYPLYVSQSEISHRYLLPYPILIYFDFFIVELLRT